MSSPKRLGNSNTPPLNVEREDPVIEDAEGARQLIVFDRPVPPTRTDIIYTVPYPTSPEERERARMELSAVGMRHGIPGLGATGEIQRTIEAVSYKVLAHEEDHIRDDWQDEDEDYLSLRTSILKTGQQRAIIATPLLPGDPRVAKGKQYLVIKGHRALHVARRERLEPVFIEVVTRPDGLPLFPYERTALYMTLTMSTKPLKGRQIFLAVAKLYMTYLEYCREMNRPFTFFTIRELGERFGISHTYAREARLIAEEGGTVLEAIADHDLQPKAVTRLLQLVPKESRGETVTALRQQNAERARQGLSSFTVPEVVHFIEQRSRAVRQGQVEAPAALSLDQEARRLSRRLLEAIQIADHLQTAGYPLPQEIVQGLQHLSTAESIRALQRMAEQ